MGLVSKFILSMYFQEICGFSDSVFSSSWKELQAMKLGPESKLLPDLADLETSVSLLSWSSIDDDDDS